MKSSNLLPLSLLSGLLIGCESVDSDSVLTSGVYAQMTVEAEGNGKSDVTVFLKVGGGLSNSFLDLVDGDELTASADGEDVTLEKVSFSNMRSYEGTLNTDNEGTDFTIAFSRELDDGAPNSKVSMPAPFDITGPTEGTSFSRSQDDIPLEWSDAGTSDGMSWGVEGDCVLPNSGDILSDPGSFSISAGEIESDPSEEGESCEATITIVRNRYGDIDEAYGEGGLINAIQIREVTLTLTP